MREKVIAPLGLRHSTYEQPLPESLATLAATGHEGGQPVKGHWHTYPEMAAAGLWTTPTDLALIAIEVQRALAGCSDKVLAKETARQMVTPQREDYGLGPGVEGEGSRTRFLHNGKNEGFEAAWMAYETTGQGAVVTETEFFSTASEPTLQFVKDAQGRFSELVVDLGGGEAYRRQKKSGAGAVGLRDDGRPLQAYSLPPTHAQQKLFNYYKKRCYY